MNRNMDYKQLARDRYLTACPIRYDCRHLFVYLLEMEYIDERQQVEIFIRYPEERDTRIFKSDQHLNDFLSNVKKFAFPYKKTLAAPLSPSNSASSKQQTSSNLVQFYPFVFTDETRIRQYGFCRAAKSGNHVLCLISYLPWYTLFVGLLNKIATIINEKETPALYSFLEALYEYELPEPGALADIMSHDGMEQIRFMCPDRRVVPSINENRNLLKFFAFFDLEKIIKIFTALLLERHILIVSRDLENMTACALALEYLIYPLEWLHAFAPIMPEHIDLFVFNQPFPFIYGVHTAVYEKLTQQQKDDAFILLVDERHIVNGDKDKLPDNINENLHSRLQYFESATRASSEKYNSLLQKSTIQAFRDSVLMIIGNYRDYIQYDAQTNEFRFDEEEFYDSKNVSLKQKFANEFYHEFRITQAFEEFVRDRSEYLKAEYEFELAHADLDYPKDFIETLCEEHRAENSGLHQFQSMIVGKMKKLPRALNKAKEKILNSAPKQQQNIKATKLDFEFTSKKQEDIIQTSGNSYEKSLDSISSTSASSSDSSLTSEENKLKETIRKIAIATQSKLEEITNTEAASEKRLSSLDSGYPRVTIDLSNDPDLKKYFESKEEKLIDFSDLNEITTSPAPPPPPPPPPPNNIINSFSTPVFSNSTNFMSSAAFTTSLSYPAANRIQTQILNPSRADTSKPNKSESMFDEFDPIKNPQLNNLVITANSNNVAANFQNIFENANRPNYNIALDSLVNGYAPSQQVFPTASQTIAKLNAMNHLSGSTSVPLSRPINSNQFNNNKTAFDSTNNYVRK